MKLFKVMAYTHSGQYHETKIRDGSIRKAVKKFEQRYPNFTKEVAVMIVQEVQE
jgi:hypothetical protein